MKTLEELIEAGKYDWVNPSITEKNYPIVPARFTTEGCKVFHFNKVITTAEIEAALRKKGYEPCTIEQLLAYGAENPKEQRKYPIVGLGFSWVDPGGGRRVPYLYGGDRLRGVHLSWDGPSDRWYEVCRFLASRKSDLGRSEPLPSDLSALTLRVSELEARLDKLKLV